MTVSKYLIIYLTILILVSFFGARLMINHNTVHQFSQEGEECPTSQKGLTIMTPNTVVQASQARKTKHERDGEFLGTGYFHLFLNSLSIHEAQMLFYGNIQSIGYTCKNIKRFGNVGDGGYDVCMDELAVPQRNNCLVYSFGIRDEWSFDEAINSYFGCDVYSFDPSMDKGNHTHRKPNMYFYKLGIWGSNLRNNKNWELRDLETIVKSFNHQDRVIDYVKVDVEGAEWPLITHLIQSDVHKQIKQIALELHTPRLVVEKQPMTVTDYAEVLYGLKELQRLGFRKFLYHGNNNCCGRFTEFTPASIARRKKCCFETFYVNTKFLETK